MAGSALSKKVKRLLAQNGVAGEKSFTDIEKTLDNNPDGVTLIPGLGQKLVKVENKNYLMLNYLGKGLCGTVYRIIDLESGKMRALKVVQAPNWYPTIVAEQTNGSFRNEVEVRKELKLLNASSFENEETDTRLLVIDYIEGVTLNKLEPPKTVADLLTLFEEMAKSFKVAHDNGYVHGDMKDVNFLVDPATYEVTLIDYGHCKKNPDSRILMSFMGIERLVCPFDFLHWDIPETRRNEKLGPGSDIYVLANKFEHALKKCFPCVGLPRLNQLFEDMRKDEMEERPFYNEVASRLSAIRQSLEANSLALRCKLAAKMPAESIFEQTLVPFAVAVHLKTQASLEDGDRLTLEVLESVFVKKLEQHDVGRQATWYQRSVYDEEKREQIKCLKNAYLKLLREKLLEASPEDAAALINQAENSKLLNAQRASVKFQESQPTSSVEAVSTLGQQL